MRNFCAALLLIAGLASHGLAQSNSGSLSGSVTDPNGAMIPGARIEANETATGRVFTGISSEAGFYFFPALPAGDYSIAVEHTGFKRLSVGKITIAVAARANLDLKMELGDVTQTVDVTAAAPLLQTDSSEVGSSFQPKLMQDGPLFVSGTIRNPQSFVNFMPGVNLGIANSFGGSAHRSAEILIDGASHVQTESAGVADFGQFPSVEQFGEFRLILNNFSAEYGRTGGGIQIFNTRSGTNELHGSVFDFVRNDAFDAAGWGVNQRRVFPDGDTRNPKKPKVRQHEWGFAAGGPVWIPKLYDGRNKTFFYFTFNGFDQAGGAVAATATTATNLMRQGDFSEWAAGIYDPLTTDASGARTPFAGNRIPAARQSAVARNIVPLLPPLINSSLANNSATLNLTDQTRRLWSIKGDHVFSEQHKINAYLSFTDTQIASDGPLPGVLTAGNVNNQRPELYRLNYDWSIRPNLLNHFTGGFSRWQNFIELSSLVSGKNIPATIGLTGVETGTRSATFPQVLFGNGLTTLGNFQNRSGTYHWTQHWSDTMTWIKGKHIMKFGGEIRRLRTFQDPTNDASVQGVFAFEPFQTAANNTTLRATTGHSFASFMLGAVDRANRQVNAPVAGVDVHYGYNAFFFQDDFKVSRKLTLNLGMRWDIGLAREDRNKVQASLNPQGINQAAGGIRGTLVFVGEDGPNNIGRKRFGDVFLTDFGPRLGLAYQWNDKTVIRAAYGLSYSAANGLIGGGCFPCTFGVSAALSIPSTSFAPAFNWDGGFPIPSTFRPPPVFAPDAFNGQDITYLTAADGRHGRVNSWSFTIQRELPGKYVFDISYMGSFSDRLSARTPVNQVDPRHLSQGNLLTRNINDPAVVAAGFRKPWEAFNGTLAQSLRPYPQFNTIGQNYSAQGSSRYNSMIAKVEKRYSDLTLMAAYTFSRTLMYRGSDSVNCQCVRPQDIYNLGVERTLHTSDIPHVLNLLWAYDLPLGKGKKFLGSAPRGVDMLLGGWTISGAQQYRSGNLLTPTLPNALAGLIFNDSLRPNVSGERRSTGFDRKSLDPNNPSTRWANVNAFSIPAPFTFGNGSYYYSDLRNPPVFSENLGIAKRTRITESTNFEVRADISNLFNRTLFGGILVNLSAPATFGRPSGPLLGPRIVQIAGRFNF